MASAGTRTGDRVTQPGWHAQFPDQVDQCLSLVNIGDCLQGQHVRSGVGQDLQAWTVPVPKFGDTESVAAAVLLAACQACPVWPYRRCHPARAAGPVSRSTRKFDAEPQEPFGLGAIDSALSETVEGGLITRCGGDLGTRREEGLVDCDDLLGRVHQQPCRPQIVGKIVAPCLKLSGQTAVGDE